MNWHYFKGCSWVEWVWVALSNRPAIFYQKTSSWTWDLYTWSLETLKVLRNGYGCQQIWSLHPSAILCSISRSYMLCLQLYAASVFFMGSLEQLKTILILWASGRDYKETVYPWLCWLTVIHGGSLHFPWLVSTFLTPIFADPSLLNLSTLLNTLLL